jgi:hypothetical protein
MGVNDREQDKKVAKRKAAEQNRKRRANTSTTGQVADWASVDGILLAKAVGVVARMGGALRLGYSRDGGAFAVGIYGDGEPFTEYVPPSDDIELWLKGVIEDYE